MRRVALVLLLVAVVGWATSGREIAFPGGRLTIVWEDAGVLLVRIRLDQPAEADGTKTWVLTDLAHRFADGVFAWQVHVSEDHQSALVIPNDFLMVSKFTLDQLGIGIAAHEPGLSLELRIPCEDPIPNLAAPGDLLEIHALWRQMAPIVTIEVPPYQAGIAVGGAGGGLGTAELPSTVPLPAGTTYTIGETIHHRFVVIDPETGAPDGAATASCSLIQIEDGTRNFRRYFVIPKDLETAVFELEIDTGNLGAGTYDLYVWTSADGGTSFQGRLVLKEP